MTTRLIELLMDETDYDAIQEAIARRQRWCVLPDSDDPHANAAGRVVAEICRGWMEMHDRRVAEDEREDLWDDEELDDE